MTGSQRAGEHASTGFLLLLGAMSAFPPITTDIYLPALPELTQSLHGTMTEGQITLSVYFVGLGFGQLFYGPWSDRIGRRPTMLLGAAIYLAASVGCAVATTMQQMILWRFLQAVGACSGVVISAAVVRDRFDHKESARIFSMLLTLRGVGPIVAPLAGGVIVTWLHWRAIFWAVTLFGITLAASVFFGLKETRTEAVAARALRIPARRLRGGATQSAHHRLHVDQWIQLLVHVRLDRRGALPGHQPVQGAGFVLRLDFWGQRGGVHDRGADQPAPAESVPPR